MKDPAVLMYIDKWLVSTKGMRADARGWYLNLLFHQYDKGSLPNDIEELANYADVRISEFEKFKQVWEQVLKQKFEQDDNGNLINPFACEILRKREQFLEKRILSGKIGYVIKFVRANFKVKSNVIEWLKNELNFDELDIKNEQVLKQVLEQKIKLYINKDEDVNEDSKLRFNECRKSYFLYYEKQSGIKPTFNGAQGANLKKLINCIENSLIHNQQEPINDNVIVAFNSLLNSLPDWYKTHLDINIIYSKYDGIIAEIRKKSGASEKDLWQAILDKRQRERETVTSDG
jgi:hypothetical protein